MITKSLFVLCVLALVQSATIKERKIPVEIRYDDKVQGEKTVKTLKQYVAENAEINNKVVQQHDSVPVASENVKEVKDALPVAEPMKGELEISNNADGIQTESLVAPVENIVATVEDNSVPVVAENIQESQNDAPAQINIVDTDDNVNVPDIVNVATEIIDDSESVASKNLKGQLNIAAKTQLSQDELSQSIKHLPVNAESEIREQFSSSKNAEEPENSINQKPVVTDTMLFQELKEIISNGLKNIRETFKPEKGQAQPKPEQWEDLEKALGNYLEETRSTIQVKQAPTENQNFFQNIASGFQTITNNFVQGLQGNNNKTNGQGDEEQPTNNQGGFQGFVSYFQGGVNNIANTIQNLGQQPTTSNTVLGDTGSTTQASNLISNIVSNVQQFFGGIQGGSQSGPTTGVQGDTESNSSTISNQQGGPVQVIQTIGSAINSIFQQRPPNTSGDEGANSTQNVNFIQSIGQNIGNAIQQFNPFRPDNQNAGASQPATQPANPAQDTGTKTEETQQGQQIANSESKNPEKVPDSQPAPVKPSSSEPPSKKDNETTSLPSPQKIEDTPVPTEEASNQKNEIKLKE